MLVFRSHSSVLLGIDENKYIVMITKDGFTKIVNFIPTEQG